MIRFKSCLACFGVVAGLGLMAFSSSAAADGTCGMHDDNGPSACPIASSGAYMGSLVPAYDGPPYALERDYYVFYASKGTALVVTINDAEDLSCTGPFQVCGSVAALLDNSDGQTIASSTGDGGSGSATIMDGIPVPVTITATLRRAGTYYLIFYGSLANDLSTSESMPVAYTFSLSGTPNVLWPPPCTVPRVSRRLTLARAEARLIRDGCKIGTITRKRSGREPAGDVLAFRPAPGTVLAGQAPVGVVLARSPAGSGRRRRGKRG